MNSAPPSGPLASPGYWLWHASLRWVAAVTARLAPLGLTPVQFFVLGGLSWLSERHDRGCSQISLARHAGLDPTMTSKVLRALEGRDLVRREPDPADARAHLVHLTDAGAALLTRAKPLIRGADRDFFAGAALPIEELRGLFMRLATGKEPTS